MPRFLTLSAAFAFLAAASFAAPSSADTKSDKAKKAAKAQVEDCLKIADPKKKDECVSNARNAQMRGKKDVSTKADKAMKKGAEKAKNK